MHSMLMQALCNKSLPLMRGRREQQ
uniref:Uncharacterized protein n=1 Tax=Anguilla anguilla TaxID=7936 RepID=A0A0E9UP99_ANGAN